MSNSDDTEMALPSFGAGDGIPFYSMGETPFEKLSRALIREEPDVKGGGKYGARGQKQYGIDVYGDLTNGQGIIVGQSKAYEEFDEDDLDKVVDDFFSEIDYWRDKKVRKFIALVGSEVERTQIHNKKLEAVEKFDKEGIDFELWDSVEIEKKISEAANCQHIVENFIPRHTKIYLERICFQSDIETQIERKELEKPEAYINRTVSQEKIDRDDPFYILSSINENEYDLVEVAFEEKRILLLGDAGLGKTYELERIAYKINGAESKYFPKIISLKNFTDKNIEDYLSDVEKDNKDRIALLFDGLDEMPAGNRALFIKKLNEYCKEENSLVIVSCRENLFEKGKGKAPQSLEGFGKYYLNELNHDQIRHYAEENLKNVEEFFKQIYDLGINNLLTNPFYLINIVSRYREDGSLPTNKSKVFDFILEIRLIKDIEKVRSRGSEFGESEVTEIIKNANLKLALTLELLGKNSCVQNELEEILDERSLNLIKFFSSIINKEENGKSTWEFEHRQLQEFFAAQGLKNLSFDDLIQVIAFPPNHNTLKPSWYNTVGLLISLLDKNSDFFQNLIGWLLENEKEVFLYLEKDRISEGVAKEILERFLQVAVEKNIGINLSYQQIYKLSNLVIHESTKEMIIDQLVEEWDNHNLISDLLILVSETKFYIPKTKERIVQILQENLFNKDHPNYIKRRLITAISNLDNSLDLLGKIIAEFRSTEDKSLKATLIYIIEDRSLQGEYFDFLNDILDEFTKEESEVRSQISSGTRNTDIPIALSSVLSNIEDLDTFIKVVNRFIESPSELDLFTGSFDVEFVDNAINLHRKDEEAIESAMFKLYIACCENYTLNRGQALLPFFQQTNSKEQVFAQVIRDSELREKVAPFNLITFYDRNLESLVIDLFKKDEIEERYVQRLLNSGSESDEISELRDKLQELQKGDFSEPQIPNWEEIRSERKARSLQVIFHKDKFLEEVENLFSTVQDDVTPENIRNISIDPELASEFSDVVVFEVSNLIEKRALTKDEIEEEVNKWDWNVFRNHKFYHKYLRGNSDTDEIVSLLGEDEINLIEDWCFEKMQEINFREALETKENGLSSTSYDALYVWIFQRVFKFDYPEEKLLEMMSYEYLEAYNEGLEYYEKFLSVDSILMELFENLDRGLKDSMVIENHLNYAVKKGLADVLKYAIEFVEDDDYADSIRKHAVDSSLEFDAGVEKILDYLRKKNIDDVFWYAVDRVLSINKNREDLKEVLVEVLNEGDDEEIKINASTRLILLQDLEGLQYYVEAAKKGKKIPTHRFIYSTGYRENPISMFNNIEGLNHLLELLELEYHEDFIQSDYRRISQLVKDALRNIGLESQENFEELTSKLNEFIQEKKQDYPNVKYLFNFLDDLGKQFYLNKSQEMDLESAVKKADTILFN